MKSQQIDAQKLVDIGYDPGHSRCGSFMVVDHAILEQVSRIEGLTVMPLAQAFEKFPHVKEKLYFSLVHRDQNEHTLMAAENEPVGYYIRVEEGVYIDDPLQAAFLFETAGTTQIIHNIIELCEGARLNIVNGCATAHSQSAGTHIGITEIYLGRNSSLGYTMIHNWGMGVDVYPVSAIEVGENASYLSHYVGMTSVKKITSDPVAYVRKGASARFYSIIFAKPGSFFDMGARAILQGEGAGGEIISRVVSDGGTVISRQMLSGEQADTIGHMECSGLLLDDKGSIHSIPELKGGHPDVNLSHEAAVGKISSEEINYLMTRGLSEEQARSLIIRGFLDIRIEGLPSSVQALMEEVIARSVEGSI